MILLDKMSLQFFALVCLTLMLQSVGVYSVAQQCYFCNTDVHGEGCNDPIVAENIQIQSCSTSEIVTSSNLSSNSDVSVRRVRDTYANVCIYMTYNFDSRNISSRGCELEYITTNNAVLDICAYYAAIVPVRITNFNCTTCISDLCNHAGAESDEVEQPEDEFPSDDDEETSEEEEAPEEDDTPEDEETEDADTEGEADSAHFASVSFALLVSVMIVKLFMF